MLCSYVWFALRDRLKVVSVLLPLTLVSELTAHMAQEVGLREPGEKTSHCSSLARPALTGLGEGNQQARGRRLQMGYTLCLLYQKLSCGPN